MQIGRVGARLRGDAEQQFFLKLLMLEHGFEVWRVHRVALLTDGRNVRSRRAIEALGAELEGVRKADRPGADGAVRDSAVYAITADTWPATQAILRARLARWDARGATDAAPRVDEG